MTFPVADQKLAAQLNALAHPARLQIIKFLADQGECVCGEIVSVLPLSQSTVSQHLKILKEAGLLIGTIDGTRSCYCLDNKAFVALQRMFVKHLPGSELAIQSQNG